MKKLEKNREREDRAARFSSNIHGPALMYYSGFMYMMNALGKDGSVAIALSLEPESMSESKLYADELACLEVY